MTAISGTLLVERRDTIALVRLNRAVRRNAINLALVRDLASVLSDLESDDEVRALVITGSEQAFSAGQDLKEAESPEFVPELNAALGMLESFAKPTVAAIDGWCLAGGLELALACDLRVCSARAKIGDWHARINSIGGAGATVRLVRLLGLARAKELVFTGVALEGEAARSIGLVSHVFPEELVDRAVEFARSLCTGLPITVQYAKQALNAAADLDLAAALTFAQECQHAVREAQGVSYADRFIDGKRN